MADNPENAMENGANGADGDGDQEAVPFLIGAQYIKDFSFENPRGIETLSAIQNNPDDSPVFIVELTYGGVVQVAGVAEEEVKPVVLIEGPRHLFPFARSIVSNAVRDGGFPPLLINPIDFQALYIEQHVDSEGSDI